MHIDDIEDRAKTYDWLRQSSVVTLIELARRHDIELQPAIQEIIDDQWSRIESIVADLADRIDAKRKDAADESRYAGMTDCF